MRASVVRRNCSCQASCVFLLLLTSLLGRSADARYVDGTFLSSKSFLFLGRFAFNKKVGSAIGFNFQYPADFDDSIVLLAYYSGADSWDRVYNHKIACRDKWKVAARDGSDKAPNVFPLKTYRLPKEDGKEGCDPTNHTCFVKAKGTLPLSASKDSHFYFAIANCDPAKCRGDICGSGLDGVSYELHMTTGPEGSPESEIEVNNHGMIDTSTVFSIAALCATAYSLYIGSRLSAKGKFHHTVKLLCLANAMEGAGHLITVSFWSRYASTGRPKYGLRGFGQFVLIFSDSMLLLLLLLLAKGWTIVRRKITAQGRVKLAIYFTIYIQANFAALAYDATHRDDAVVTFLYESPAGYWLVGMRIVALLWLLYAIQTTRRRYDSKHGFYRKFTVASCLWMLARPISAAIGSKTGIFAERTYYQANHSANIFTLFVLTLMYNPNTRFNSGFPFHARTSDMRDPAEVKRANATGLKSKVGLKSDDLVAPPLERLKKRSDAANRRIQAARNLVAQMRQLLPDLPGISDKPSGREVRQLDTGFRSPQVSGQRRQDDDDREEPHRRTVTQSAPPDAGRNGNERFDKFVAHPDAEGFMSRRQRRHHDRLRGEP